MGAVAVLVAGSEGVVVELVLDIGNTELVSGRPPSELFDLLEFEKAAAEEVAAEELACFGTAGPMVIELEEVADVE